MLVNFYMRFAILCIVMGMLSGCGSKWFRDRSEDYVKAEPIPTIKVPKDTHCGSFSDEYHIPDK